MDATDVDRNDTDGDEIVYQTAVEEIDQERVAGITEVAVSMDCAGYIDNEVSIFNVYNLDMRTTDVVGRVGAAVDIETTQEFDEATITFTYDDEATITAVYKKANSYCRTLGFEEGLGFVLGLFFMLIVTALEILLSIVILVIEHKKRQ